MHIFISTSLFTIFVVVCEKMKCKDGLCGLDNVSRLEGSNSIYLISLWTAHLDTIDKESASRKGSRNSCYD